MASLSGKEQAEFRHRVEQLNEWLERIRVKHPAANFYLANDTLNVLSGPSHDDAATPRPRQDRVMASARLKHSGGGDW